MVRFRRARFKALQCTAPWLAPYVRKRKGASKPQAGSSEDGGIKPGDIVEVRSFEEISKTLNAKGMHKGLFFMPEQRRFCGQRFKVYKRPQRIMLELTGEMRDLTTPSFFLEGAYCDGRFHDGCDRSCFCMWREEWLKRVEQG